MPSLFYLAGFKCTNVAFSNEAGAQHFAARHGVVPIAPDTSPTYTIDPRKKWPMPRLSCGQQQLVTVAGAVAMRPEVNRRLPLIQNLSAWRYT